MHPLLNTVAVQWAFIGPMQECRMWQQIEWNHAGVITAIKPIPSTDAATLARAKGLLALPGFVNAHTHLELSIQQAIALTPSQTMGDWLLAVVHAANQITPQQQQLVIQQGIQEAFSSGTTTLASTVRTLTVLEPLLADALPPIRTCWWLEWFHPDADITTQASIEKRDLLLAQLVQCQQYLASCVPHLQPSYVTIGLSPHSPYNVSVPAWQAVLQQCAATPVLAGLPWQTHLLESVDEVRYYQKQPLTTEQTGIDIVHQTLLGKTFMPMLPTGVDIVTALQGIQALSPLLSVVHGLELSTQQATVLAQLGVCLVTCPRSNRFLHGKYLPEQLLTHPNLTIAIGTDAHVSLPEPTRLDIRLELQALKKVCPAITWQTLLRFATLNGAKALGMPNKVGELSCGAFADITCWHLPDTIQQEIDTINETALLAYVLNSQQSPNQVFVNGTVVTP